MSQTCVEWKKHGGQKKPKTATAPCSFRLHHLEQLHTCSGPLLPLDHRAERQLGLQFKMKPTDCIVRHHFCGTDTSESKLPARIS